MKLFKPETRNNLKQSPQHILFLPRWYPSRQDPQLGIFIRKHAQAVAQYKKVYVLYILPDAGLKKNTEIVFNKAENLEEVIVYVKKETNKIRGFFRQFSAFQLGLKKFSIPISSIELIHVNILLKTGIFAMWLSKKIKVPYVITEQWSGYSTVSGAYNRSSKVKKWLTKRVVKSALGVITVSDFLKKEMLANGLKNTNYFIVPNVVEPKFELKAIKNGANKKEYIDILVVADLVDEIKNVSGLIDAFSEIEYHKKLQLTIIGGGKDKEKLESLADQKGLLNNKIFFLGLQPNEVVHEYLAKTDFLVVNSRVETFSAVCIEALLHGKPVIATRCGGPQEIITPEVGILIDPNNGEELKDSILKMADTFGNYSPEKLRRYAIENYGIQPVGKKLTGIYDALMTNKNV